MAIGWKFWIIESSGIVLSYPCSENKVADQLRSYCEADLHLCFRIYGKCWFSHFLVEINIQNVTNHLRRFFSLEINMLCHSSLDFQIRSDSDQAV